MFNFEIHDFYYGFAYLFKVWMPMGSVAIVSVKYPVFKVNV